jgi:hypothetical protein
VTATLRAPGEVAQLVEHTAENRGVAGSIPALAISPKRVRRPLRVRHDDSLRISIF